MRENLNDPGLATVDDQFATGDGNWMNRDQLPSGVTAADDDLAAALAAAVFGSGDGLGGLLLSC